MNHMILPSKIRLLFCQSEDEQAIGMNEWDREER